MARDLTGKRYSDMGDRYRSKFSRQEFRAKRKSQRKAGESGALDKFNKEGGKENSAWRGNVSTEAPGVSALKGKGTSKIKEAVDNTPDVARTNKFEGSTTNAPGVSVNNGTGGRLEGTKRDSMNPQFRGDFTPGEEKKQSDLGKYNLKATGVGENQKRLSRGDLKGLLNEGYSKEQLVQYGANLGGGEGKNKRKEGFAGAGAQKLLGKWMEKMSNPDAVKDLDPKLVEQAGQGQGWGKEDQARYDELLKKKDEEDFSDDSTTTTTTPTTTGGNNTGGNTSGGNAGDTSVKDSFNTTDSFNNENQQTQTQEVDNSRTLGSTFTGNVTGDGNNIDLSNTDNSFNVTQGGTVFNYQGGQGNSVYDDTPMSALTLGQVATTGDGSNAAGAAAFLANHVGMHKTLAAQRKSQHTNHGSAAIKANEANRADPDPNNLINEGPLAMKDRATVGLQNLMGDSSQWRMPKMPSFNLSDIRKDNYEALGNKDDDDD